MDASELSDKVDMNHWEKKFHHGELACSLSHLRAIATAWADGVQTALIVEDDISFEYLPAWPLSLQQLALRAPANWEILQLYTSRAKLYKEKAELPYRQRWEPSQLFVRWGVGNESRIAADGILRESATEAHYPPLAEYIAIAKARANDPAVTKRPRPPPDDPRVVPRGQPRRDRLVLRAHLPHLPRAPLPLRLRRRRAQERRLSPRHGVCAARRARAGQRARVLVLAVRPALARWLRLPAAGPLVEVVGSRTHPGALSPGTRRATRRNSVAIFCALL